MSKSSVILKNVASNWAGFALNAIVTLILTPFVLRELGTARYGVWILTSSIIGYYGFLDLGFRAGVTQYLTRYLSVGDYRKASECLSSAVLVLSGLAALMFSLSVLSAYVAPRMFHLSGGLEREAFWTILIVGCTTGVNFAFTPFMSVFMAVQRFDLASAIGIVTRLLSAAAIVFALKSGYGLIGVSAATCLTNVLDYVIRWRVATRLIPEVTVSRHLANRTRLREITTFGVWNFVMSVNAYVYQFVPNLLIGSALSVAAVGHYALATGLSRQINSVLSPIGQVVYPTATTMHSRGDVRQLERLYHDGTRLVLLVTVSAALGATFWAHDFYRLWVGEKFLSGTPYPSVALLLQVLLFATVTNYLSNIGSQMLSGSGRVRELAMLMAVGSVLNVAISIVAIRYYGLLGVALGTAGASVIVDLICIPILVKRVLGFSVASFLSRACTRPIVVAIGEVLAFSAIRLAGPATDWYHLVAQIFVGGLASAALIAAFGVTAAERERFLIRPLRRTVGLAHS